ncbi:MAG: transporter substrate-binding domain-containing protein [Acidimicrobiia bacterium]|nr:transporter substrate-binding domain-containing protein [Acidimicrobiia bacterium]
MVALSGGAVKTVAGDGTLTVDFRTDFAALPYSDTSGDTAIGFEVDILSEAATRSELVMEPAESLGEFSPAALHHLWLAEKGDVDVVAQGLFPGLYAYLEAYADAEQFRGIDAARAQSPALFTDPYYLEDFGFAVNVELHPEIRSLADLEAGMTVATYEDAAADLWVVENLVPNGIDVSRVTNGSVLSPLSAAAFAGNVVGVIHSLPVIEVLAADIPEIEIVDVIDADVPVAFAVDPSNESLHEALNEALAGMVADGTYQTIYDRWFTNPAGSVVP